MPESTPERPQSSSPGATEPAIVLPASTEAEGITTEQLIESLTTERDAARVAAAELRAENMQLLSKLSEASRLLVQASVEIEKRDAEIEKRKAVEKYLIEFGTTSAKTGLPNEVAFGEELETRVVSHRKFAVGKVDLTNFKAVNDRYGEAKGDVILKGVADMIVAAILTDTTRAESDFVAHLHGDTYAFIIDLEPREGSDDSPEEIVEKVGNRVVGGINEYATLSALEQWGFTGSVGIAIHEPGEEIEQTLLRAEALMKEHKAKQHSEVGAYRTSPTN